MSDICNGCGDLIKDEEECSGFCVGEDEYVFCVFCSTEPTNIETIIQKMMLGMDRRDETIH